MGGGVCHIKRRTRRDDAEKKKSQVQRMARGGMSSSVENHRGEAGKGKAGTDDGQNNKRPAPSSCLNRSLGVTWTTCTCFGPAGPAKVSKLPPCKLR